MRARMPRMPRILALAGTATALAAAGLSLPGPASAAAPAAPYDFNGDGYRDLAAGVPAGTAGGEHWAGYVAVVPGSANGPVASRGFRVGQSSPGIPGSSEEYDQFGDELTSSDLNSDGYAELIVAAPGESGTHSFGGRITILWSSPSGFTGGTTVASTGSYTGMGGGALEVADVTGDGKADIVAGGEGDEEDDITVAAGPFAPGGSVQAVTVARTPTFSRMGGLATGDFDGDGRTDVAASYGGGEASGSLLLRGTASGLERADDWYDESTGSALVAGDFNKDGRTDLAYGRAGHGYVDSDVWEPKYPMTPNVGGTVRILFGSPQGPAGDRAPRDISQETPGVPGGGAGASEQEDLFGLGLAAGDADGDGNLDLVAGTPGEAIGGVTRTGAATVLYGTADGPGAARSRSFHQGTDGISGTNEKADGFGEDVQLRDLTGDGRAELGAGVPGENAGSTRDAGRVVTLPGTASGTTATGSRSYGPGSIGLPTPHVDLYLGRVLG